MTCTKNWTDSSLFQVHFDARWSLFAVKCVRCRKDTNWLLTHTYPSECTIPKSWFANSSLAPMFRWDILSPVTFVSQLGGDECFYFFIRQALSAMVITNSQTFEILDLACGISQENCTEVVWMRFKGSRMNAFCCAKVIDNHCHDGSRCNLYRPRRLSC